MPSLPLELERLIFELAAYQDTDHDSRVGIILVAKRVYEWIRPIMYSVAIADLHPDEPNGATVVLRNWRNAQMTDVARFTRHLLTRVSDESHVLRLLSTFRDAEDLAIWRFSSSIEILKRMDGLPLRMLSVDLATIKLDDAIKNCKAFLNLTHLDILDLNGITWEDFKPFIQLPKLTHLCISKVTDEANCVFSELLKHCPSLRLLIYLVDPIPVKELNITDPRFLSLEEDFNLVDYVAEWQNSANRRIGFWEHFEMIAEARNAKLFRDDSSSLTMSLCNWMDHLNDDGVQWYNEWSGSCVSARQDDQDYNMCPQVEVDWAEVLM